MDKRNQSSADWLRDHPEAGTELFPYAKSPRDRRKMTQVFVLAFVAWILVGLLVHPLVGFLAFIVVAVGGSWRSEAHPWLRRYRRPRDGGSDAD